MALHIPSITGSHLTCSSRFFKVVLKELVGSSVEWNSRVKEWLDLLEKLCLCNFWQVHWFEILSHVCKFDTNGKVLSRFLQPIKTLRPGLIIWNEHAPRLFTAFLVSYDLPVGTATGAVSFKKAPVPLRAESWFSTKDVSKEHSIAKCIIYMLRNDRTNKTILPHVTKMINLLEQFCHPSNGGEWTASLASLLKYLVKHLIKVISTQVNSNNKTSVLQIGVRMPLERKERI